MIRPIIEVENISKCYRLGQFNARSLRDEAERWLSRRRHGRANGATSALADESEFWALRDVSFFVQPGKVLGIIGPNGAGKSTLLKIMARVTEPTSGEIRIRGRVASLLEVGTGFHPELTGRENIYLNGAILGMTRAEIKAKFEEIVDFAGVEKFIETPVKRYSSGMYVRLAFAVAAHLEPEILIVDEVLAVGDASFQKKCLGKMREVSSHDGRTIILVSHNMAAIANLCFECLLLQDGRVASFGSTPKIINEYLINGEAVLSNDLRRRTDRIGNGALRIEAIEFLDSRRIRLQQFRSGDDAVIAIHYTSENKDYLRNVHIAIGVQGLMEEPLFHLSTSVSGGDFPELPTSGVVLCKLNRLPLSPGTYRLNIFSRVGGEVADWVQRATDIVVADGDYFASGKLPPSTHGALLVQHSWEIVH